MTWAPLIAYWRCFLAMLINQWSSWFLYCWKLKWNHYSFYSLVTCDWQCQSNPIQAFLQRKLKAYLIALRHCLKYFTVPQCSSPFDCSINLCCTCNRGGPHNPSWSICCCQFGRTWWIAKFLLEKLFKEFVQLVLVEWLHKMKNVYMSLENSQLI